MLGIAANLTIAKSEEFDNNCSWEDAIDRLKDAGFRNMDLSFYADFAPAVRYGETEFFADGWKERAQEIRAHADQAGVRFVQTHAPIFNYFVNDEGTKQRLKAVENCIEMTAIFGADVMVIHPETPHGLEKDAEVCMEMNAEVFRRFADHAARFGVRLAVENMICRRALDGSVQNKRFTTPEELNMLVDRIDRPNVGICIDVGHAHYMRQDVARTIRVVKDRLIALHINDNNLFDDQHLCPYAGTLDWDGCLNALQEVEYPGYFTLEVLHYCEAMPLPVRNEFLRPLYLLTEEMGKRIGG